MNITINRQQLTINKSAFTLIELLVVISIIGILAAMITVSFTASQRQARDAQRKSDLIQYRTALESYASKSNGLYVVSAAGPATGNLCTALVNAGVLTSTSNCPEDPRYKSTDTNPYLQYQYQSDVSTRYALWAQLENTASYWVVCSNGTSFSQASAPSISSCQ